jgi:protein-L-isoaspartate(D-aspartate) O-methyltransferase
VTAASEDVPGHLVDQLALGGVLVVPVGRHGGDQELLRVTRHEDGLGEERLGSVRFVPLLPGLPGDQERSTEAKGASAS